MNFNISKWNSRSRAGMQIVLANRKNFLAAELYEYPQQFI